MGDKEIENAGSTNGHTTANLICTHTDTSILMKSTSFYTNLVWHFAHDFIVIVVRHSFILNHAHVH